MLTREQSWQAAVEFMPRAAILARAINRGTHRAFEDDDLVQEGLIEYARVAQQFESARGVPLNAFVYRSVWRRMVRVARCGVRLYQYEQQQTDAEIDTWADEAALQELARYSGMCAALAFLPDEQRHILEWLYVDGETLRAIGRKLGTQPVQTLFLKREALEHLRRLVCRFSYTRANSR